MFSQNLRQNTLAKAIYFIKNTQQTREEIEHSPFNYVETDHKNSTPHTIPVVNFSYQPGIDNQFSDYLPGVQSK